MNNMRVKKAQKFTCKKKSTSLHVNGKLTIYTGSLQDVQDEYTESSTLGYYTENRNKTGNNQYWDKNDLWW